MQSYINKKVLIFGLGLNEGGIGAARFFANQGVKVRVTDLKVADILKPSLDQLKNFRNISYTLGQHKYSDIDWADLIIKNPAVNIRNPYMDYAKKKGKLVKMDIDIFLEYIKPSQIIGITGTKGKSTTASLIYGVLKGNGVILAGNIGTSVLDTIPYIKPDALVVLELSSFQLESFDTHKISPKWAVITNIYPDHLNYYSSMAEYVSAKRTIGKYQSKDDFLYIKEADPIVDKPNFLKRFKAKIVHFSKNQLPKNFNHHLLGEHNLENMAAVLAVGRNFGIDDQTTLKTLASFKGMPFRMELIKVWHGVKIYNDTTATGPDAGEKALKTFPGCILICGGMNKRLNYSKYATAVGKFVKKVFFLEGDATDEILKFKISNLKFGGIFNDLEKLLTSARSIVKAGDVILFSPAATSFNLFQNEFDRGRKFNQAVKKIFT